VVIFIESSADSAFVYWLELAACSLMRLVGPYAEILKLKIKLSENELFSSVECMATPLKVVNSKGLKMSFQISAMEFV